ncbi:MAG: AAA family ATPase [Lachnospiraceae bacterium]|nr:AAA family ATPase [Lachnospiraceae bacterium]
MSRFEKIIGYGAVKEELSMALDAMLDPEKYKKLGVKLPSGILLNGVPGVGKTLFAKEFIAESGRRAYTIRKSKPDGAFVDYIRETFNEAAKNAPSIIFLDDMDKFANEDCYHPDAEEYVAVQACIDDVKDKDVFVFATTNSLRDLPESLKRNGRFDWIFTLDVPKHEDAEEIIAYFLKGKSVDENIDVTELSRFARGYSCASLEKVVNDAGLHAAFEGRNLISQNDLIQSTLRTFYGMKTDKSPVPEKVQRQVAVHEAGHTVIAEILSPGVVDFASICCHKNSEAGGYTCYHVEDEDEHSFVTMENRIMMTLGGKAATEIISGETDLGSESDMRKAFDSVRRLIDNYTSYDFDSWEHGDKTAQSVYESIDRATSVEVSRYYKKVKQLLIQNRKFLDAVIEKLYEKKTISYKDLKELSAERKIA